MKVSIRRGALLGLLAVAVSCGGGTPAPEDHGKVLLALGAWAVEGQQDGAAYVGEAFARSFEAGLRGVDGLEIRQLDGDEPPIREGEALVEGRLIRTAEGARASLAARPEDGSMPWTIEADTDGPELSALCVRLQGELLDRLGLERPRAYGHISEVQAEGELGRAPLFLEALQAARSKRGEEFVEKAARLVEEYPRQPAAQVLDAWALTLAWDADPADSALLSRLRSRLDSLAAVDPRSPYDDLLLGYVFRSSGEPDRASLVYSRVLARTDLSASARAWALRQRAFAYLAAGYVTAARNDAEQSTVLDPLDPQGHFALSKALEAAGEIEPAAQSARRALALRPDDWRHLQRVAMVYMRAGQADKAAGIFADACAMGSRQEACANLAVSLERADRPGAARRAAERAERLEASPWGQYNLACYWSLAGETDRALDTLGRSVSLGFADVLIESDPDLDNVRRRAGFTAVADEVSRRLSARRELTVSTFPWQT